MLRRRRGESYRWPRRHRQAAGCCRSGVRSQRHHRRATRHRRPRARPRATACARPPVFLPPGTTYSVHRFRVRSVDVRRLRLRLRSNILRASRSAPPAPWWPCRRCRCRNASRRPFAATHRLSWSLRQCAPRLHRSPGPPCRSRRRRTAGSAHRPSRAARPVPPGGRCRRSGSPRWRRCRSR